TRRGRLRIAQFGFRATGMLSRVSCRERGRSPIPLKICEFEASIRFGVSSMSVVLVIDDDRSVLHLVTKALESPDLTVKTSRLAAEGLEMFSQTSPDVVLLDILLPSISGLDVFKQIQKIDRRVPVIFIT